MALADIVDRVYGAKPPEPPPEEPGFLEGIGPAAASAPAQFVGGAQRTLGNLQAMMGREAVEQLSGPRVPAEQPIDTPARMTLTRGGQPVLGEPDPAPRIAEAQRSVEAGVARAEQADRDLRLVTPEKVGTAGKAVISLAQSAAPTLTGIAAGIVTKNPGLAMLIAGGGGGVMQGAETYGEAFAKTGDHRRAGVAGTIDAVLEGAGESLPLGIALKPGTPVAVRIFNTIAAEAGQEAATQAMQDLHAFLNYNPDITLREAWDNLKVATLAGGLGGAVYGSAGAAAEGRMPAAPQPAPPGAAPSSLEALADKVYGETAAAAPERAAEPEPGVQSKSEPFELEGQTAVPPDSRRPAPRKESGFGPTLSRGQLDLFTDAEPSPAPQAQAEAQLGQRVNLVRTGAFRAGVERASTREDAAHILAPLRKEGQESLAVLALDAEDRPLGIIRHSIGGNTQTSVYPGVVVPAIASVPGVKSVWFSHNHPSGVPSPSAADQNLQRTLEAHLRGTGIGVKGHIIVAPGKQRSGFFHTGAGPFVQPSDTVVPTPAVRKGEVPVLERRYRKIGKLADAVTSPQSARAIVPKLLEGKDGIVFLDAQNQPVATLPIAPGELEHLRTDTTERGAAPLMRLISESNASAMFAHFPSAPSSDPALRKSLVNLSRFSSAMDIRLLDAFASDGGALQSLAERGTLPSGEGSNFQQRNIEKEQGLPVVGGTRKSYFDQQYKHSQPVRVTFEDGTSMYDAVKGLNAGHALWRAGENWPGAKIEPVTLDQVKAADPESYREITRYEAFGLAQLSPRRQRMYATLVDAGLLDPAPSVPVPALDVLQEGELPLTRGQHQVVARAAGQVVRGGMPNEWVAAVKIASTTEKNAGPANYNLGRKAILLREQNLNGAMAGEPGSQAWLATALAHEIIHRVDHGQGATLRDAMASAGATRLAPDGDLMIEAREAYEQGPVELSTYLAYPFATSLRNNSVTLAIEVTAQMGSLYATASDTLRASAPRWHALFEEVYRHAEVAAAHRALREGLRAQPAAVANQGVRAGADRGAGDYVEDRGSLASRSPGPGVGGVQTDGGKSGRSAAARARIRDTDSLFVAIAKLGGLNRDEVVSTWGADPADIRRIGPKGGKVVVRAKGGGLSLDGMAEALHGIGYLDERDLHEFEAKFDRELRGEKVYTYPGQEAIARGERPEEHELEPIEIEGSGFADLPDAEQDAVAALVETLRGRFRGTAAESRIEEIIEEADAATRGQPLQAFHNAIVSSLQGIVNATQQPGTTAQRGANQAGSTAPPARAPPQGAGAAAPGQPVRFDVADPGNWDALVRTFQDNKVDLKRLQAAIRELRPIAESEDAYLKDEARISRTADKVERFRKGKAQDLIDKIRKHKLTLDEVEQFLWARHAREANAHLKKINGQDGLSGMSSADAAQALSDFQKSGKLAGLKDVAATVDAIIDETRNIYVAGGLERQETIDAWKATYDHYVPLHREGFEDRGPGVGRGYTIRGPEAKKRIGSKRAVENILANVFAQHEAAIVRAEKNRVDRALWDLFRANPNPAFWEVGKPGIRETVDVDTGLAVRVPDMNYKNVENALVLKIDGDEKVILFNAQNERARETVKALRNLSGGELSWYVAYWARANRLLANLSTSYNPVFWATNLVRDVGTVAFNLQSTELRGKEAAVMRRIPLAMWGVRDELRANGRSKWAQTYREAKAAGGMTGWMQTFDGIKDRANEIVSLLRSAERGAWDPRVLGPKALQFVKDYNDVIEHATRTAVYATAIDEGMSKDKAASLAKNMSVNFNRKGTASTAFGAFYMFFNASVQGSARMIEGATKSKRVWAYMGVAMGLATALDIINRTMLADDDDDGNNTYDNISNEIKLRNFIVMRPGTGGKFWKIPMPYGYNVIANLGRVMGEFASKDEFEAWQAAGDIGNAAAMSFVPTGEAPTYAQLLSPSLLDPVAQVIENKNWQGFPIYREQPEHGARLAEHERGMRTTPVWAKSLAREIAAATEEKVSINPGALAALVTSYTGGLGYTTSQTYDFAQRALTGQEMPTQAIPLVSRFAGEDTEGSKARRYFELKEKALALDAEVRRLKKLGRGDEAAELERSKPHLATFLRVYRSESAALKNLYKEFESAKVEDMSPAERISFQDDWVEKRGRIYSRVIRKTNEARH